MLTSWTSPLIKVDKEIPASGELVEEFRGGSAYRMTLTLAVGSNLGYNRDIDAFFLFTQ